MVPELQTEHMSIILERCPPRRDSINNNGNPGPFLSVLLF